MKVILITGSYPPLACGVGDYSYNLSKALVRNTGTTVSVLTSVGGEGWNDEAVGVNVHPVIRDWSLSELKNVVKIIWLSSPDIVHIQYPTQGYNDKLLPYLLPIVAFLMRKKVVQTWHEIYSNRPNVRLVLQAIVPGGLVVVRPNYQEKLHLVLQKFLCNKIFMLVRNTSAVPKVTISKQDISELRKKYLKQQKRLIVFFGFIYEHKGVEQIFDIANPDIDHIVIAGQFGNQEEYSRKIHELADTPLWKDKTTITGFLKAHDVAKLLAISDAVVLPFRTGGGDWNTSIHSAILQRTFVLTTSESLRGYDEQQNVYYAEIDNVDEMKVALNNHAGKRRYFDSNLDEDEWKKIALSHYALYEKLLT